MSSINKSATSSNKKSSNNDWMPIAAGAAIGVTVGGLVGHFGTRAYIKNKAKKSGLFDKVKNDLAE